MKNMIAVVALVVGINAPVLANELPESITLTDINAINRIGVILYLTYWQQTTKRNKGQHHEH